MIIINFLNNFKNMILPYQNAYLIKINYKLNFMRENYYYISNIFFYYFFHYLIQYFNKI